MKREFQCVDKFVVVIIDGEPYTLKVGDRLVFSARQNDEAAIFYGMGDGAMSLLCTYYNEDEAKLSTAETEIEEMLKEHQRLKLQMSRKLQPPRLRKIQRAHHLHQTLSLYIK